METVKKKTPLQSAKSTYTKAKKALAEGKPGASKKLDDAVKRISQLSCRVRAKVNIRPGKKTVSAKIGARKKSRKSKSSK